MPVSEPAASSSQLEADEPMLGRSGEVRLEDLLTYRLSVLAKLMNRQSARSLSKLFGLSIAEWWMISQLDQYSPRTLRALAESTQTDKAQLSRAAASLVKNGYVRRQTDPKDGRSVLFWMTPEGQKLFEAIKPLRQEVNARLLERLTQEEQAAFFSAMEKLTAFFLDETESGADA